MVRLVVGNEKKKDEVNKMDEEHQKKVSQRVPMAAQGCCTRSPSRWCGEEECRFRRRKKTPSRWLDAKKKGNYAQTIGNATMMSKIKRIHIGK